MASDESMITLSTMHEDDEDEHPHYVSRLSFSSKQSAKDLDSGGTGGSSSGDLMMKFMSALSIEADEELSSAAGDHKEPHTYGIASSDSEEMSGSFMSLPATPLQPMQVPRASSSKEYYFSENEGEGEKKNTRAKRNSKRRAVRERWLDREWEKNRYKAKIELDIASQISGSTIETSSGGNSPVASWKVSSPGDDPKDVKARLKVWAQAVATSASRLVG